LVKITVLGSYNQDVTLITPKIPKPKETISGAVMYLNPGGKGNNQANAAHKLGAEVLLIAKIGKDSFGNFAIQHLQEERMDTTGILQDNLYKTGTAVILVNEKSRENMIVVAPGANHHISIDEIENIRTQIESSDICIFQFENNIDAILYAMKIAHKAKNTIILNPAPMMDPFPNEIFEFIDILIVNEIEAAAIANQHVHSKETALKAAKLITKDQDIITIVTLGGMGVIAWDGIQEFYQPAYKVKLKDTTGAGDAFIGAFAVEYGNTQDILKSLKFASAVAAINITRIGASSGNPTLYEVKKFLGDSSNQIEYQ
jgi:ribokinase